MLNNSINIGSTNYKLTLAVAYFAVKLLCWFFVCFSVIIVNYFSISLTVFLCVPC